MSTWLKITILVLVIMLLVILASLLLWFNSRVSFPENVSPIILSLSILQTFLAGVAILLVVLGFVGFWVIRSAVLEETRKTATEEVKRLHPDPSVAEQTHEDAEPKVAEIGGLKKFTQRYLLDTQALK